MLTASEDYQFGPVNGQVREGVWWEGQYTHRFRRDFDMTLCFDQGINPFDDPIGASCADASLFNSHKAIPTPQAMRNSMSARVGHSTNRFSSWKSIP